MQGFLFILVFSLSAALFVYKVSCMCVCVCCSAFARNVFGHRWFRCAIFSEPSMTCLSRCLLPLSERRSNGIPSAGPCQLTLNTTVFLRLSLRTGPTFSTVQTYLAASSAEKSSTYFSCDVSLMKNNDGASLLPLPLPPTFFPL